MSDVTLFENNALANSDLFKSLQDVNNTLLSGSGGGDKNRRISLNGSKFREFINGEQVSVSKEDNMNMVIVNAAPISRSYYESAYDHTNPTPPKCWSADTNAPAKEVAPENRQASRCMDCPQSIKGSGAGGSRACRFAQRLAVALEGQLDKVYQLQLPATSVFGEAKDGKMPMQAYARFLSAHNTPAVAIVTNMRFDENASVPKLFFKAVRPLDENELQQVVDLKDHPDTVKAITFTVSQTDGVSKSAPEKPAPQKKAEPAPLFATEETEEVVEEPIDEPTKVVKKSAPPKPADDDDLSSIINNWDDED
jgi:hypothetical protein